MKMDENIFTADGRALECCRPARRRGITKLMPTPPRGAVRSGLRTLSRVPGALRSEGRGLRRKDGFTNSLRAGRPGPNVRPPDVDTRR
jgi:hypothetical protein